MSHINGRRVLSPCSSVLVFVHVCVNFCISFTGLRLCAYADVYGLTEAHDEAGNDNYNRPSIYLEQLSRKEFRLLGNQHTIPVSVTHTYKNVHWTGLRK